MEGILKSITRGMYDVQKLRIQMGNRVVANFKTKIGQSPGDKESEISDAEAKLLLKRLRQEYDRITDGLVRFPTAKTFKGTEIISQFTELCLIDQYIKLVHAEDEHLKRLESVVKIDPLWCVFLDGVVGIGPAMAGVLLSEIDITKSRHPSSLWKYSGLDVAHDGAGRSRKKEHLEDSEYVDSEGEIKIKKGITYNPFLKTKLMGVIGSSFLRAGKDNKYSKIYYDYKNRIENHPNHKEKSKGQRHQMATRYMVKQFLIDLYVAWRTLEGLPVSKPYHEAKLGHTHGQVA
jgi:hypothetical protein